MQKIQSGRKQLQDSTIIVEQTLYAMVRCYFVGGDSSVGPSSIRLSLSTRSARSCLVALKVPPHPQKPCGSPE